MASKGIRIVGQIIANLFLKLSLQRDNLRYLRLLVGIYSLKQFLTLIFGPAVLVAIEGPKLLIIVIRKMF